MGNNSGGLFETFVVGYYDMGSNSGGLVKWDQHAISLGQWWVSTVM